MYESIWAFVQIGGEMVVELICVGTELLLGNIVNTNAAYLSEKCAQLGLSMYHQSVVGDNAERLKETLETAVVLIAPFAPHLAEELWQELGHEESVFKNTWPEHDEDAMKDDEIEVPVQINGKTKIVISIPADISKEDAIARGKEALGDKLTGNIIKEIYVPKKIINIVAK